MFFLMGIGTKEKSHGDVNFKCVNCLNDNCYLIERANSFSLFFISLFRFSKKYFVYCENCRSIYKLKNNSIRNIFKTKRVSYEDIEEVVLNGSICKNCGVKVEPKDTYCHKCGKKL